MRYLMDEWNLWAAIIGIGAVFLILERQIQAIGKQLDRIESKIEDLRS